MKSLHQHIEEKLVINRNYKGKEHYVYPSIEKVLSKHEYGDKYYKSEKEKSVEKKSTIEVGREIWDLFEYELNLSSGEILRLCNNAKGEIPEIPTQYETNEYKEYIVKYKVDKSKYKNAVSEIFDEIKNNDLFSVKNCIICFFNSDEPISLYFAYNEKYNMYFCANDGTNEVYSLMIVKLS